VTASHRSCGAARIAALNLGEHGSGATATQPL
jgi:hypothetical protein